MKYQGILVYKGKSQLDGENIIAVATKDTKNEKTGDAIQIWILRGDIGPIIAKRLGYDFSICGNCPLRDVKVCYCNLCHGPLQVFKAYHNDRYEKLNDTNIEFFRDKEVRLGAYGDPTAVPISIWDKIAEVSNSILAYTHQWNKPEFQEYKKYCMASTEDPISYKKAQELDWRTFNVKLPNEPLFENEYRCPASKEAGVLTTCSKCQSCKGLSSEIKKSVAIEFHGVGINDYKLQRFIKFRKAKKNKKKWRIDFSKRIQLIKELCKI